jgi:uncharacterized protein YwqG
MRCETAEQAWRLRRPCREGLRGHKFAGAPWLAEDEEWPLCESGRRPMQFFFQLDLNRLPTGRNKDFSRVA